MMQESAEHSQDGRKLLKQLIPGRGDSHTPLKQGVNENISRFRQSAARFVAVLCLAAMSCLLASCKKDATFDALDTDANGYLCLKCGAKFYTERTVFMARNVLSATKTRLRRRSVIIAKKTSIDHSRR